mgnify:CR=1 FL=1
MRKMVFLLALALGLHLQAQELDVCTKPYGEEQEIIVIKPTVANFLTLLSLTEEQFQKAVEESSATFADGYEFSTAEELLDWLREIATVPKKS